MTENTQVRQANIRTMRNLVVVVIGMFGFGFALVPLYNVFCEITGFDGRTGVVSADQVAAGKVDTERTIAVEFVAVINGDHAWEFKPDVKRKRVHPGELAHVDYYIENKTGSPVIAQAIPSIAPNYASQWFSKTECFCFVNQRLEPGERVRMPVRFVVDSQLPASVRDLTLSYTYFKVGGEEPIDMDLTTSTGGGAGDG